MNQTNQIVPEFWIDVGGTFTDCLVRDSASNRLSVLKVLSSGITKGRVVRWDSDSLIDSARDGEPNRFWQGVPIRFLDESGEPVHSTRVTDSEGHRLRLAECPENSSLVGLRYELVTDEPAPLLAIRTHFGLPPDAEFPPLSLKLGTTRGTNALLTRSGSPTALVTTRGFADALAIGDQARPDLFALTIRKRPPLFQATVEIDERITARGDVLKAPDPDRIRQQLAEVRDCGIESLAVALLHAWRRPDHEEFLAQIAAEFDFRDVTLSHRTGSRIGFLPRAETAVLDAYLNPILRDYLDRIRRRIPGGRVRVMTSAGGLIESDLFTGRESLLSGPAGGVSGIARLSDRIGESAVIGFDMGGTSTDVCRYAGRFLRSRETITAGVRVSTPTLRIETVAAGGGSLCTFDGVRLRVGPESASADPGPACYGRGGPLTVTDLNVFLGRVPIDRFPFPLDSAAITNRLDSLLEQIERSPTGRVGSQVELAEGLLRIANETVVRAIRGISIGEGIDPADCSLMTFGGAGGQHACALARELRIDRVIVPKYAGVFSAWGIGLADIRRVRERTVLRTLAEIDDDELSHLFTKLSDEIAEELAGSGVTEDQLSQPEPSLDLRAVGQETTLTVTNQDSGTWSDRFAAAYQTHFGTTPPNRPVEVVVARVERVASVSDPHRDGLGKGVLGDGGTSGSPGTTEAVFGGNRIAVPLWNRRDLRSGSVIEGPVIILDDTSTIVIEPGFRCGVGTADELRIEAVRAVAGQQSFVPTTEIGSETAVNAIRVEVFQNRFAAIAEQMGESLRRMAVSTNVKDRLDYSCAVFTPDGDLIANAPHVPVHLGAMGETVRSLLEERTDIRPGDVYVSNDPYRGGSHLPDVTVMTPVHDRSGHELLFWTASRAHHAEIGGITPGSMPPFSKTLAEEGVRIRFELLRASDPHRAVDMESLLSSGPYPSRRIADNLADLNAQIAANAKGQDRLLELCDGQGREPIRRVMRAIREASAERVRQVLENYSGERVFVDHLDDGSPIKVRLMFRERGVLIDFTGTGPVLPTNLNANRAIVTAAVMYVLRCLVADPVPLNAGILDPVELRLPRCLLNPPEAVSAKDCPAVVGGNVETSQRLVDVLFGAFDITAAGQGTMNNFSFGDDRFGYYETIGGGAGATEDAEGADAVHVHMTNTRLTDVELLEHRYPVRVEQFSIRRGSGGRGQYRGGHGLIRELEFLEPLTVSLLTQRRGAYPPYGCQGGEPGKIGRNLLIRSGGEQAIDLGAAAEVTVCPGDRLRIETPGGGGWGQPGDLS